MAVKMVFFDLDGTLLPMDMDEFTMGYFQMLAAKAAPRGYEQKSLVKGIWHGVSAMVQNDGHCTNEEAFWEDFAKIYGEQALLDKPLFDDFYANEFQNARMFCGYNPEAAKAVRWIKEQGIRIALATNPLFPKIATYRRIRWAGLDPEDFQAITTYETSCTCKPNPDYYREICRNLNLDPAECIMIGNDVEEDAAALETGMQVYLVTDCLINRKERDLSMISHGNSESLETFLKSLSI